MNRTRWVLWAATIFALAALIAAPLAGLRLAGVFNIDGQVSWLTLFAGVFITGALVWWVMTRRDVRFAVWRGALAGVFVAVLGYPVVILISQVVHHDWSLVESPVAGTGQLFSALIIALISLVSTGWVAALVMAAAGAIAATLPARVEKRAQQPKRPARSFIDWALWVATTLGVGALGLLVFAFVWLTLIPLDTRDIIRQSDPGKAAKTYEEALAMFAAVQADEAKLPLNPVCRSFIKTHGQKVAKAVVFYHGLTNCPAQGVELAEQLFAEGYNVYMPRLPEHGMADVLTTALSELTAEQMVATGEDSIDLAHGLGDEVLVSGLSAGGTLATWAAQVRGDASLAMPMAPFLGANAIPTWATRQATNLLLLLPNLMIWWDATQAEPTGMDYAYPRYATHGLAQMIRLGAAVEKIAEGEAPKAQRIVLLLNDNDTAVNNAITDTLAATWKAHGVEAEITLLPKSDGLPHDIIDPHQPQQDTALVYPMIVRLLAGEAAQ